MPNFGASAARFKVEKVLGVGGTGKVYLGYDRLLDRHVAIKTLHEHKVSPLSKRRFIREARVLSRLHHPAICRIHDLIDSKKYTLLVLEFIDGPTLKSAIKEGLSFERKLEIAVIVADVLVAAHSKGIVHRDLKLDNVMINSQGKVKVLDFGLATIVGEGQASGPEEESPEESVFSGAEDSWPHFAEEVEHTTLGSIVGTLRYMSPEQARGEVATIASDMYSLGILLQRLFTEKSAYEVSGNFQRTLKAVSEANTLDPKSVMPNLDSDLVELIKSLKQLEPEDRPNAQNVYDRLIQIAQKPQTKIRKKNRLMMSVAVVLMLAMTSWLTRNWVESQRWQQQVPKGRLAVLPFEIPSDRSEDQWLEMGLSEFVTEILSVKYEIETVSSKDVSELLAENGGATAWDEDQALVFLGATSTLEGRVVREGQEYELHYQVRVGDRVLMRAKVRSPEPMALARAAANYVGGHLNPGIAAPRHVFSPDDYASTLFLMGQQTMRHQGPAKAMPYFQVAFDRDPHFLMARLEEADCLADLGEMEQARGLIEEVMIAARRNKDLRIQAQAMLQLSTIARIQAKWEVCQSNLESALNIFRDLGLKDEEAEVLSQQAIMHNARHQPELAQNLLKQALIILQETGNRRFQAKVLSNLGIIENGFKNYPASMTYYQRALAINREFGNRKGEAANLSNISVMLSNQKKFDEADTYIKQSQAIYSELGMMREVAICLNNRSSYAQEQGLIEESEEILLQCREILGDLDDPIFLGIINSNLGNLDYDRKQHDAAIKHYEDALKAYEQAKDDYKIALICSYIAESAIELGQWEQAEAFVNRALSLNDADPLTLAMKGDIARRSQQLQVALEFYQRAKTADPEVWSEERETQLQLLLQQFGTAQN